MAKKKRISQPSSETRNSQRERTTHKPASKSPPNNTPYLIIIGALLLIIAYLLSGGGQNPAPSNTQSSPLPVATSQPVLFTGVVPEPDLSAEFAPFYPDNISGWRRVKLQMDPLSDETGGQFLTQVKDRANVMYLRDSTRTDFEIEYSVYKMESAEAANQVLNYYTSHWNNIPVQHGDVTFWIWNGYDEQLQRGSPARPYGVSIYWDTFTSSAFLPTGGRRSDYFISEVNQTLYCLHGETARDKYFIMVDVHAPLQNIDEFSNEFFAMVAAQITSQAL